MSICAYCGEDRKATREHIIPDFIYSFQKNKGGNVGWNERAQKLVPSEGKIKDVCAICNNERLGGLDGAVKTMFEDAGIMTQNYLKDHVEFKYDYNVLKRWLLKVSYNSARAASNNAHRFKRFIPFIMGDELEESDVEILVGLYKPEILSKEEMKKFDGDLEFGANGEFNPFHSRIAWTPELAPEFKVRMIVMGALLFHIIIFNKGQKVGHKKAKLRQWLKRNPKMSQFLPSKNLITVKQLSLTFVDTQEAQFARMEALGALKNF
ncbi:hypothetical protein ACXJY6_02980 [Vibrio sp. RC27]